MIEGEMKRYVNVRNVNSKNLVVVAKRNWPFVVLH